MITPDWEEILVALLNKAGIKAYPLVSPLESNHTSGHVVYNLVTEGVYNAYEGDFVDNILISIDARSESYINARDLLKQSYEALRVLGRHRARFVLDREPTETEFDPTTRLYRFIANVYINPYYQIIDDTGNRAFSSSFSLAFG